MVSQSWYSELQENRCTDIQHMLLLQQVRFRKITKCLQIIIISTSKRQTPFLQKITTFALLWLHENLLGMHYIFQFSDFYSSFKSLNSMDWFTMLKTRGIKYLIVSFTCWNILGWRCNESFTNTLLFSVNCLFGHMLERHLTNICREDLDATVYSLLNFCYLQILVQFV